LSIQHDACSKMNGTSTILPPTDQLIETIRRIRTMSLDQAQASLNNLIAKVDAGDIDGGKAALSELKVRNHETRTDNA
jgi:hypothetical protein